MKKHSIHLKKLKTIPGNHLTTMTGGAITCIVRYEGSTSTITFESRRDMLYFFVSHRDVSMVDCHG